MGELQVGLIGYGAWARSAYVPALRLDGRSTIVAVAAVSTATQDRAVAELGSHVRTYPSAETLLNAGGLDAVAVAVPDLAHEATLDAALESGVPVLFEPPVASDRDGVERMIELLRDASQPVYPDLELSYLPVAACIRAEVDAGAIGQTRSARIRLQAPWGHTPSHTLSPVHVLAGWYLDLLDRLIGRSARRILMLNGHESSELMQPRAIAHLDYEDVLGTFDINIASVGSLDISVELNGDEGDITCNPLTGTWRLRNREHPSWAVRKAPALEPPAGWPGVHECFRAFLDAVEHGTEDPSTRDALIQQHKVGLAADRSCASGAWENVQAVTVNPAAP